MNMDRLLSPSITGYDELNGCFTLSDRSVMNIFKIKTHDRVTSSVEDISLEVSTWEKFFRTYGGDVNIVALNSPCNYSQQTAYWEKKRNTTSGPITERFALNSPCNYSQQSELIQVQCNQTREFYLMYFVSSAASFEQATMQVTAALGTGPGGLIRKIERDDKIRVLRKLMNKTSTGSYKMVRNETERIGRQ